jgi:hypothetical protein
MESEYKEKRWFKGFPILLPFLIGGMLQLAYPKHVVIEGNTLKVIVPVVIALLFFSYRWGSRSPESDESDPEWCHHKEDKRRR